MQLDFEKIKAGVIGRLKDLSPYLTYHCVEHTLDVVRQAERIAIEEGIKGKRELLLLKIAALYHDTGFLESYMLHEPKSADIFLKDAAHLELSEREKEVIHGLIMATTIPQQPATILERILCDADLDYLGRVDFLPTAEKLRNELLHYQVLRSNEEWENLQEKFLQNHRFHTWSSQKNREPVKQRNLSRISGVHRKFLLFGNLEAARR